MGKIEAEWNIARGKLLGNPVLVYYGRWELEAANKGMSLEQMMAKKRGITVEEAREEIIKQFWKRVVEFEKKKKNPRKTGYEDLIGGESL